MPVAVTDPPAEHDNTDLAASATADHCPPCPCCGVRMIIVESFGRGGAPRGPPPPEAAVRATMPAEPVIFLVAGKRLVQC
jgi:hypothetical protein